MRRSRALPCMDAAVQVHTRAACRLRPQTLCRAHIAAATHTSVAAADNAPFAKQQRSAAMELQGCCTEPQGAAAASTAAALTHSTSAVLRRAGQARTGMSAAGSLAAGGACSVVSAAMASSSLSGRQTQMRPFLGLAASLPEAAGLPQDEAYAWLCLLRRHLLYGPTLGLSAAPLAHGGRGSSLTGAALSLAATTAAGGGGGGTSGAARLLQLSSSGAGALC